MRWLALILALQAAPSASTTAVLRGLVEARAGTAADGQAQNYTAGGLYGALRFGTARATPDGSCRSFVLTASDVSAGPFSRFAGDACLSPGGSGWRTVRLQAAETAAPHPPFGLPIILPPHPEASVGPPSHLGHATIDIPPQLHPGAVSIHKQAAAKPIVPPPPPPPPPDETPKPPDAAGVQTPSPDDPAPKPPPKATLGPAAAAGIAARLPTYPITYNKPQQLSFDVDTPIALTIRTTGSADAEMQGLPGEKVTASAHLSDDVVAELTGDPAVVRITTRQDKAQRLADLGDTTWVWDVRALTPDPTSLTLTLSANVMLSDKPARVPVRTYTDRIPVVMDPVSRIKWWLDRLNPVLKALGLGTPVVVLGALWAFLRRRVGRRGGGSAPPAPPAPAA